MTIGQTQEIVVILIILAVIAFDIAMLMQVAKNSRLGTLAKLIWAICIVAISPFGALYYFYWADLYRRRRA